MKKLLILVVIVGIMAFTNEPEKTEAQTYYDKGLEHLENESIIEALAAFTSAVDHDSTMGEAYLKLGYTKAKMSKMFGYDDMTLCFDLTKALELGELEAEPLLEQYCMGHCYDYDSDMYKNDPSSLFCVDLSHKELEEIPNAGDLKNVVKLIFHDNHATHIPSGIGGLKNIINLDLSHNLITELHDDIGQLTYLRELNLNKNELETLPYGFSELANLKKLYIRQNNLTRIPSFIALSKNLEVLDLSMNHLKSLPIHISALKNLKTLILVGNEFTQKNQSIIKTLLPNTEIQF